MRDTDYAFCVARIRAKESQMLSSATINKLIEADDYNQTVNLLKGIGWIDDGSTVQEYIKAQQEELWKFLCESVPDKNELKCLCVLNDFFNIKVAIKCVFTGENADNFYIRPTSLDLDELNKAAASNDYTVFGEKLISDAARKAYEIACRTENGQNAEIVIDSAAIEMLKKYSELYKNSVFSELCAFIADTSNIKTAIMCCATSKNDDFVNAAISVCFKIDRKKLIDCAAEGSGAVFEYLSKSCYAEGTEVYLNSPAMYDKWCDDRIVEITKKSMFTAFGFDPVCSYYYAKINEIKTVRMILTAKLSGVPQDILKERMRVSYA